MGDQNLSLGAEAPGHAHRERRVLLERIEECEALLWDATVSAAMAGPWREWADAQPVGAATEISTLALMDTNDAAVSLVARALAALGEARETLVEEAAAPRTLLSVVR